MRTKQRPRETNRTATPVVKTLMSTVSLDATTNEDGTRLLYAKTTDGLRGRIYARIDHAGRVVHCSGNPHVATALADAVSRYDAERDRHGEESASQRLVATLCSILGAKPPSLEEPYTVTLREDGVLDPTVIRVSAPSQPDRLVMGTDAQIANESVSQTTNRLIKTQHLPYATALSRACALHGAKSSRKGERT